MKIRDIPTAVADTEVSTVTNFMGCIWGITKTCLKYFIAIYLIITVIMFFMGKL